MGNHPIQELRTKLEKQRRTRKRAGVDGRDILNFLLCVGTIRVQWTQSTNVAGKRGKGTGDQVEMGALLKEYEFPLEEVREWRLPSWHWPSQGSLGCLVNIPHFVVSWHLPIARLALAISSRRTPLKVSFLGTYAYVRVRNIHPHSTGHDHNTFIHNKTIL